MGFFGLNSRFFRPAAIKVEPEQIDPAAGSGGGATIQYVNDSIAAIGGLHRGPYAPGLVVNGRDTVSYQGREYEWTGVGPYTTTDFVSDNDWSVVVGNDINGSPVLITNPQVGHVLTFDGSNWINQAP